MEMKLLTGLLIFAVTSAGGWAILWIGIRGAFATRSRYERERSRASGRVEKVTSRELRYGRRGRRMVYYAEVSFRAEGRAYRLECPDGLWKGAVSVGDEADVLYDPDDPTRFHLGFFEESDRRSNVYMMLVGGVWLAVSLALALLGAHLADG